MSVERETHTQRHAQDSEDSTDEARSSEHDRIVVLPERLICVSARQSAIALNAKKTTDARRSTLPSTGALSVHNNMDNITRFRSEWGTERASEEERDKNDRLFFCVFGVCRQQKHTFGTDAKRLIAGLCLSTHTHCSPHA